MSEVSLALVKLDRVTKQVWCVIERRSVAEALTILVAEVPGLRQLLREWARKG